MSDVPLDPDRTTPVQTANHPRLEDGDQPDEADTGPRTDLVPEASTE